jgi:hypothetical protein
MGQFKGIPDSLGKNQMAIRKTIKTQALNLSIKMTGEQVFVFRPFIDSATLPGDQNNRVLLTAKMFNSTTQF